MITTKPIFCAENSWPIELALATAFEGDVGWVDAQAYGLGYTERPYL